MLGLLGNHEKCVAYVQNKFLRRKFAHAKKCTRGIGELIYSDISRLIAPPFKNGEHYF